jgi:hypothetical protein
MQVLMDLQRGAAMGELATFLTVFCGSTAHVKNPYLRSKLGEVSAPHHLCPFP